MRPRTGSSVGTAESTHGILPLPNKRLRQITKEFKQAIHPLFAHHRLGASMDLPLVEALVHCVIQETSNPARTPKAEALLRGIAARERLKTVEGGHISAEDAARILGISKVAVLDRYHKGHLLGWRAAQSAVRFPIWQFGDEGLLRGFREVVDAWKGTTHLDDWAKILFFLSPLESLNNTSPLELLRKGETKQVVQLALSYGE